MSTAKQSSRHDSKFKKKNGKKIKIAPQMKIVESNVAGIDLGSQFHYVAASEKPGTITVRRFGTYTSDLYKCAEWLIKCNVKSVAMESTGVYWVNFYSILEDKGLDVCLVDGRSVKNVSGRKTDVSDAEWLQQLHSYGLLKKAFVPPPEIAEIRTYHRYRSNQVTSIGECVQRMQKALIQMNLRLDNVLSDVLGKTGRLIIESILAGNRNPKTLAQYRDKRCEKSEEEIEESLRGHYRDDQLFILEEEYKVIQEIESRILRTEQQIQAKLKAFATVEDEAGRLVRPKSVKKTKNSFFNRKKGHEFSFDLEKELIRITGVNLAKLPGVGVSTALTIITEAGLNMSRWKSAKHFASWVGLAPNNKMTGGKTYQSRAKPGNNRLSTALRMGVSSLYRETKGTAIGCFLRRKKAHKGPKLAITAAGNKLARTIYMVLSTGKEFEEPGEEAYLRLQKDKILRGIKRKIAPWGYSLVETSIS